MFTSKTCKKEERTCPVVNGKECSGQGRSPSPNLSAWTLSSTVLTRPFEQCTGCSVLLLNCWYISLRNGASVGFAGVPVSVSVCLINNVSPRLAWWG